MRYNIFNTAHLPVKTALVTACISVTKTLDDPCRYTEEALQKAGEVLHICDEQITYESLHILPYVFEYEPFIWSNYTSEHDTASMLSEHLKGLVQSYHKQQKAADKTQIMSMIRESYNEFILFNFNHMDDEEPVLNEILWRYYPDAVLVRIEEKMDMLPHLAKQRQQTMGFQIATAA